MDSSPNDHDLLLAAAYRDPWGVRRGVSEGWEALEARRESAGMRGVSVSLEDGSVVDVLVAGDAPMPADAGWLEHLVKHDDLTGFPNRSYFLSILDEQMLRADASSFLMLVGIEDFRDINDVLGHAQADQVLRAVADRIILIAGKGAIIGRVAGTIFGLVVPNLSDRDAAAVVAERMIEGFQSKPIVAAQGFEVDIACAVGMASLKGDGATAAELMHNAKLALVGAHGDRIWRYQFYRSEMSSSTEARASVRRDLSRGFEANEFSVYYQPKIDLATGRVIGMEALSRWNHAERGLIPPNIFIPLAERSGLIAPLTDQILVTACHDTQRWRAAGHANLKVAVNLSLVQFRRQSVVGSITSALEQTGLDPSALEIEITEGVLMQDDQVVLETFDWLRSLGVTVAIDDFGTGYSSLSYLGRFPIDVVKIDGSFVYDLDENEGHRLIVRAITNLCHCLNLKVVAEGVESLAHADYLRSIDCDIAQGYHYGRPMPALNFEAWLAAERDAAARGSIEPS